MILFSFHQLITALLPVNQSVRIWHNQTCLETITDESQLHELLKMPILQSINVKNISTDSRKINKDSLFVAIQGEQFDGHDFLNQVFTQGKIALIEHTKTLNHLNLNINNTQANCVLIEVESTLKSLQQLAKSWQNTLYAQQLKYSIGVVGSNGKTTVKEMIFAGLQAQQNLYSRACAATTGNLNNHLGVPLSILNMPISTEFSVLEMGMNHMGETKELANIAMPSISVINNAQREHQEFMLNIDNVALEHACILDNTKDTAVLPYDSPYFKDWANKAKSKQLKVYAFGRQSVALDDLLLIDMYMHLPETTSSLNSNLNLNSLAVDVQIFHQENQKLVLKQQITLDLNCLGAHNQLNAMAASCALMAADVPLDAILQGIHSFTGAKGRLQVKHQQPLIIDDTYNANPDSVKVAIDVLASQNCDKRCLILGDMGEVGLQGVQFHEEIGEYAFNQNIHTLITFGQLTQHTHNAYCSQKVKQTDGDIQTFAMHANTQNVQSIADVLKLFKEQQWQTILIKGSRFTKMENVLHALLNDLEV